VKIEVNHDWSGFLSALLDRRVRFLLIGGHAVAGHGEPRLTEDLDVFVQPTLANARRIRDALVDFGFAAVAPTVDALAEPDVVFMLGRKPWRIDILTGIDGVSFAAAWNSRVRARFGRRSIWVIGRTMLLKNKRAAARPKDLADVAMLEAHAPRTVANRTRREVGGRSPARKR
jgi:hypothetical protein